MARSKDKIVRQKEIPKGRRIVEGGDPDSFYQKKPSWVFNTFDTAMWSLSKETVGDALWDEIIPYLKNMENKTWQEILIKDKKENHAIDVGDLNKVAKDRLVQLCIEAESVYSLRIKGTHRFYGTINDGVFSFLWYDTGHGDNDSCVCRSKKKHT